MDFTQQHLDTINELAASYFKNGEAKTVEDVNRVLDLVTVSRTQKTTKADPTDTFLEQIKKRELEGIKDAAEKQKKFEPKVPWPERSRESYRDHMPCWISPSDVLYGSSVADSVNSDFPRTA